MYYVVNYINMFGVSEQKLRVKCDLRFNTSSTIWCRYQVSKALSFCLESHDAGLGQQVALWSERASPNDIHPWVLGTGLKPVTEHR